MIDSENVFVDWQKVQSYSFEIKWGELFEVRNLKIKEKIKISNWVNIVLFNKPIWYVCSKEDKHNKTIYEISNRPLYKKGDYS